MVMTILYNINWRLFFNKMNMDWAWEGNLFCKSLQRYMYTDFDNSCKYNNARCLVYIYIDDVSACVHSIMDVQRYLFGIVRPTCSS